MYSDAHSNQASVTGDVARGVARGLLWKALAAVVFSQVGVVVLALVIGGVAMLGAISFVATDEPECDATPGDPTYVSSEPSENALADIPADYLDLYKSGAGEHGIDWAVLAAVGKIETDHGRSNAPGVTSGQNFHGCCAGPMQFHNDYGSGGGTWGDVGYDANGDGETDIYDPGDAIPSAAKYLKLGGAPGDYQAALFQYNNAQWYVDDVLAQAEKYRQADSGSGDGEPGTSPALLPGLPSELPRLMSPAHAQEDDGTEDEGDSDSGGSGGEARIVAPVDGEYMDNYRNDWGDARPGFTGGFHDGTDITAPRGAPIYSMVDGVVQEESNSNENMYQEVGGYNAVIEASESVGPIEKGDWISYAHLDSEPVVRPGDRVTAGQVVGEIGDTGYGPEVTRGEFGVHLHMGWYDMTGGERAEHSTGAINPYPLLEWIEENGGEASGEEADNVAPTETPESEECERTPAGGGPGGQIKGSGTGKEVVEEASKYDGTPYGPTWGGLAECIPGERMDCTCLTLTVFKEFGFTGANELPDAPQRQRAFGQPVEGEPQAGDLVIYADPGDGSGGHAAIATGDGGIFHCASPALGCLFADDYSKGGASPVVEIRRLVEDDGGGGSDGGSEDGGG